MNQPQSSSRRTLITFSIPEEVWYACSDGTREAPSSRRKGIKTTTRVDDSPSSPRDRRTRRRRVRLKRTNLRVKGLSLNRSQKRTALLSTTPRLRPRSSTNDLAPLRRTWLVSPFGSRTRPSTSAGCRRAVALPPRRPKSVAPRISSPADVEELTVSSLRLDGILT